MRISPTEAARRIESQGLKPLQPYPGAGSAEWKLRCNTCQKLTLESLVKVEKRSRPGCKVCCSKSPHRLTDVEARARLRSQSLLALEPYPGQVGEDWEVECALCGERYKTSLSLVATRSNPGCSDCGLNQARESNTITAKQAEQRLSKLKLVPLEPYPGSTKTPWKVQCKQCNANITKPLNHLETGTPCSKCKEVERSNLASALAEVELRDAKFVPLSPYPGPDKGWWSNCMVCNRQSSPSLNAIRYHKSGCRHCGIDRRRRQVLESSLPRAKARMRKSGFTPIGEFKGFTKPWESKCTKCEKVSSPAPKWLEQGHGCRHCAKNAPWSKTRASQIARKAKRRYLEPFQGSRASIEMECLRCGNHLRAKPYSLLNSKGFCSNCTPSAKWTSDKAVQLMRAANMEPLEPFRGSTMQWKALCNVCETVGSPRAANISSGQGGCKVCGSYGFDIKKPTTLYVLYNRELGAVKVGITNTGSTRLRTLASVKFKPGKLYEFDEGSEPLEIETLLLRYLKKTLRLKQALTRQQMRGAGGATETFWVDQATPSMIHGRIRMLRQKA